MSPSDPHIGRRLKATRKEAGLVVADLAKRFRDITPPDITWKPPALTDIERMIRFHESGECHPGPRYRLLWAAALNTTEDRLFGEISDTEPGPTGAPMGTVDQSPAPYQGTLFILGCCG